MEGLLDGLSFLGENNEILVITFVVKQLMELLAVLSVCFACQKVCNLAILEH